MNKNASVMIVLFVFLGLLALSVYLGSVSSNFLVGTFAFIGIILSFINLSILGKKEKISSYFYTFYLISMVLLGLASTTAGYTPLWLIITLFFFSNLQLFFASEYAFLNSKTDGFYFIFLNFVSLPLFVIAPQFFPNRSDQSIPIESWAWSFAVSGISTIAIGFSRALKRKTKQYFICVSLGLISLIVSTFLIGYSAGWWWLLAWIPAAILIGFGGSKLPRRKTKSGLVGIAISILVGLIGLGIPLLNSGVIPNPFLPKDEPIISEATIEGTLSEIQILSTELAAAEAKATEDYQNQIQAETQTEQALAIAAESTPTPQPTLTATEVPTPSITTASEMKAEVSATETETGPGFFPAIGSFLWGAIKSVWGILYLLLCIGLAKVWLNHGGGAIFLVLLILAVGILGGRDGATLEVMTDLVSSGPANWWTYILRFSQNQTGTIGWGILTFAALTTLLLSPAINISSEYSQKVLKAQKIQLDQGKTAAQKFLSGEEAGCLESLSTLIYLLASSSIPISLWVALRRLASESDITFPFLFVPNLVVPHWKPVWHYGYFIIGALFMLTYLLNIRLLSKYQPNNPFVKFGIWGAVSSGFIMTLIAPGGFILFMTWQLLLITILQSIFNANQQPKPQIFRPIYQSPTPSPQNVQQEAFEQHLREIIRRMGEKEKEQHKTPERQEPPPGRQAPPSDDHLRTISEDQLKTGPDEEPLEQTPLKTRAYLEGSELARLDSPLVGGYLKSSNRLCLLTQDNHIFWLINGKQGRDHRLPLGRPLSLHVANDHKLLVIDQEGKVFPITAGEPIQFGSVSTLEREVKVSAANPYGTLLAYVPQKQPTAIRGYFITGKRDKPFIDLEDETISSLAFSRNARFLAAGTEKGNIMVIDIATQQLTLTIPDPHFGSVRFLEGIADEQWVVAYGDGWLVSWDLQKNQYGPVELSQLAGSLAVDLNRGRILVGDQDGYLWGYPLDLSTQEIGKQAQERKISHVFIAPDGTIVTVGEGKILRKLNL